jgi:hypothetical protein
LPFEYVHQKDGTYSLPLSILVTYYSNKIPLWHIMDGPLIPAGRVSLLAQLWIAYFQ